MRNKRGQILSGASFELILGAVVAMLIVALIFMLFSPSYSEASEVSESYLEILEGAVELADEGESASFFILDNGDKKLDFYLVYFGEALKLSYGEGILYDVFDKREINFVRSSSEENGICICYWNGESSFCRDCMSLEVPALSDTKGEEDFWIIVEGSRITVSKNNEEYIFNVK